MNHNEGDDKRMAIKGLGMDAVELSRSEKIVTEPKSFLEKVLTPKELEKYHTLPFKRKVEFLAGRFAVKEATSKALGVGISKEFSFHDVEVKKDENGKPYIEYGDFRIHLTISHTDTTVVAFVVLEKGD